MHKNARIPLDFYLGDHVIELAKQLLGCRLCTSFEEGFTSGIIVETEAYRAPEDKASHAFNHRRTPRTETMYAQGGICYIYLCYGIHHLFNIVTGPANTPHAILIRALEPVEGVDTMCARRKLDKVAPRLTAGPGSLTQALGIRKHHNALSLTEADSPIWIEKGERINTEQVIASPRVGVDYAEECAAWPWRFRIKGSRWTSPAK